MATLQEGDSYLDTVVTEISVYQTSKPALCGQYGKSWVRLLSPEELKSTPAYPQYVSLETGMPSFTVVPSTDRWTHFG